MTRRHNFFGAFHSKDRYIEEVIANQEKELEEIRKRKGPGASMPGEDSGEMERKDPYAGTDPLTPGETRGIIGGALAAGLLIGAVLIGGMFLFLLFCTKIWFA